MNSEYTELCNQLITIVEQTSAAIGRLLEQARSLDRKLDAYFAAEDTFAESIKRELRMENNTTWTACANSLPPDGIVVITKIDDSDGLRNEQPLKRKGRLWFLPDGSMYVYYSPTHWKLS